jgi:hypothetical protein
MDTPRKKIQKPSRPTGQPVLQIPEIIRLADGREFNTQELLRQRSSSDNYNLKSKTPKDPRRARHTRKYLFDDWVFIYTQSIDDIQKRYQINRGYAKILKSKSKQLDLGL